MQRSAVISTSRGKKWERLHSLWIGWTFTLGFFSWLAFAYIGIRARHPKWLLWAVFYAGPLLLFAVITVNMSQAWSDATLTAGLLLSVFSIIHAFLVRKEYLLRLDLIRREASGVSLTSMGRGWEWRHSLWILWTLTFGFFSWIAFLYIAFRARRGRWVLWSLVYFAIFLAFAVTSNSWVSDYTVGVMIVAGGISVVHAFAVREDYLVRLERRMHEVSDVEARTRYQAASEGLATVSLPDETVDQEKPKDSSSSSTTDTSSKEPDAPYDETAKTVAEAPAEASTDATSGAVTEPAPEAQSNESSKPVSGKAPESPTQAPPEVPKERPAGELAKIGASHGARTEPSLSLGRIADTYPLPIAYSWSLLQGIWDPRDRYREQLRLAENMLAFLGSVSLAILDDGDYERAQLDLRVPWQGGISFGAWKLIVQRCAKVFRSYRSNPLASDIRKLSIGSEDKVFGADVAALISARNNFHHGRGPVMEEDIVEASNEAQERLQRCMEALSFLTKYPIRLVQDFDVDRRNDDFLLKCLRLEGDGPGFRQEKISFPKALPRGDLVLDLGDGNWAQLYPFVVASNCPHCRYRETYFVDRWNDRKGTTLMKSFERGHTEERRDVSDTLASLAEGQKPGA